MAEVEISAMTFGPFGVGRRDGKAVMVPGSVVGDKLDVERSALDARLNVVAAEQSEAFAAIAAFLKRAEMA